MTTHWSLLSLVRAAGALWSLGIPPVQPHIAGEKLAAIGAEPESTTPEEYVARIQADTEKWTKVIQAAKIKAE
jgi:hypothetical protein